MNKDVEPPTARMTTWRVLRLFISDMSILLLIFLVVDVALRLIAPQPLSHLLRDVYEPKTHGYVFKAGTLALSNNGFGDHVFPVNQYEARDRDYQDKQPGEWRIMCLGDSFNENQALEISAIYPNIMERSLNLNRDRKYSVLDAGMAGWGMWDYIDYAERHLDTFQPDVMVLAISFPDDVARSTKRVFRGPMALRAGLPVRAHESVPQRLLWTVWYCNEMMEEYSHAYSAFRNVTYYPSLWMSVGRYSKVHPFFSNPSIGEPWREPTTHVLKLIRDLCSAHGTQLVILNVPRAYEVQADVQEEAIQIERLDLHAFDDRCAQRMMASIVKEVGVPYCDPSEVLRNDAEPTYFDRFAHWNERGNIVVARELERVLEQAGLLGD